MFNITNHQGNANQMSYHLIPVQMPIIKKTEYSMRQKKKWKHKFLKSIGSSIINSKRRVYSDTGLLKEANK